MKHPKTVSKNDAFQDMEIIARTLKKAGDLYRHLTSALVAAKSQGCDTQMLKPNELKFRACEGFYSKGV